MHLLDGSNVSGYLWGDPRNRKSTLDLILDAYRGRRKRAIVVFDGPPDAAVPRERTLLGNVEVRLAAHGADRLLAVLARRHPGAVVITADSALAAACRRAGATVETPRQFLTRLEQWPHAV